MWIVKSRTPCRQAFARSGQSRRLPAAELATRYVELAGGPDRALAQAGDYAAKGDLRFAATLLNHVVFADPGNKEARSALLTDEQQRYRLILSNGVLLHRTAPIAQSPKEPAGLTLTLTKPQLLCVVAGKGLDGVEVDGDRALLGRLFSCLTRADRLFPIVTP